MKEQEVTMHQHKHDHCQHQRMKYCQHCQKPYCMDCGEEWNQYTYWYYPNYYPVVPSNPYLVPSNPYYDPWYGNTSSGIQTSGYVVNAENAGGTITPTCAHESN